MATTAPSVNAWTKPGAWAVDSEEHEEELIQQEKNERENGHHLNFNSQSKQVQPLSDFPTLTAALSTKTKKKKGSTTLSLSEFTTGKAVTHGSATQPFKANKGLTTDELLALPTGPRERSAEELERGSRLGGGFRSYGDGGQGRGREDSSSRWGSERGSGGGFNRERENTRDSGPARADETDDWGASKKSSMGAPSFERRERESNRDSGPSRADEADDWGAAKKSSMGAPSFERRERGVGGGGGGVGFFDSQSRADDSDSWVSNKSRAAPAPRRVGSGGGGFENRERRGGFEFQKETSYGGGANSDTWGKKREEGPLTARTRLVLQPKTLPTSNGEQEQESLPGSGSTVNTKGSNPFGEARPREEVLAEKGQDWKKIDEKLEEVKTKENGLIIPVSDDGSTLKIKKSSSPFGEARPREEVLAEKGQDWKKIDEQLESVKIKDNGSTVENGSSFGKKAFSNGNGRVSSPDGRTERSWRKTESVDVAPPASSAEIVVEDVSTAAVAEN